MKKNVYSITLFDDVVRGIDGLAARCGATRSGMINRILADYLRLSTPETRRESIFSELARLMENDADFLIHSREGDSLFAVRSSIRFKYNPTVRYSVTVKPDGEYLGELCASLRTQNPALIEALDGFFEMWQSLEDSCFGVRLSSFGGGRFTRRLTLPPHDSSAEALGAAVADYIRALNLGISRYFAAIPDMMLAAERVSRTYGDYIRSNAAKI